MKVGVIDADLIDNGTRHPNLAIMKISGYYKEMGHQVTLLLSYENISIYDRVFISKVFTKTFIPPTVLDLPNVTYGGTGFFEDGGKDLPEEIEHHIPDYTIYTDYVNGELAKGRNRSRFSDYLDYSIGFTTRGCFRKCSFCVNKKYDHAFRHSPVSEFLDEEKPYIYLWDDNVLAYSGWRDIFKELNATGKPFQFRQGLDLRLMTDEKAAIIANSRYHGDFIFAFDHIEDKEKIERNLLLWRKYTTKTTKLYLLCAYDSIDVDDIINVFERIKILMYYGCLPYIMRYENYLNSRFRSLYTELARWCNQPQFFKKKSFREFCIANQEVHKNKDTYCSAYKAMLDFENEYPAIAKKYFDLRFDQENKYVEQYGLKSQKHRDCEECEKDQKTWLDAYHGTIDLKQVLTEYFSRETDLRCLTYKTSKCKSVRPGTIANWFVREVLKLPWNELLEIINNRIKPEPICPENIPQISSIEDAIIETPHIIYDGGNRLSYAELGYYLGGHRKDPVAQLKYGENHSKLAALLDLVAIYKKETHYEIGETLFGKQYHKLSAENKKQLAAKLLFRLPVIQELFIGAANNVVYIEDYLNSLSQATITRRTSSIKTLVEYISRESHDLEIMCICDNIKTRGKKKCRS